MCWGRSRRPVLGPAAPGGGLANGKVSASNPPSQNPSLSAVPPEKPSSLSSSLGKSPARPSRDRKSGPAAGHEQWSGKLVKRFFSPAYSFYLARSVTGWCGKKADRQSESFYLFFSLSNLFPISASSKHSQQFQHLLSILSSSWISSGGNI